MKFAQPFVLACAALLLFGCGQKGPLVLPDAQKHKRTIPTLPGAQPKPSGSGSSTATPAPAPAPAPAPSTTPAPPAPNSAPASPPTSPSPPVPDSPPPR